MQSLALASAVRDQFLADHYRLEALLEDVIAAFGDDDREALLRLWATFDSELQVHMETEEARLIPALQAGSPRHARIVVQEHRHLRGRLAELGVLLDLRRLRLDMVRAFGDELRAHARSEERLLYRWADDRLEEAEKVSVVESLTERSPGRRSAGAF